jgi:hypothetical protein
MSISEYAAGRMRFGTMLALGLFIVTFARPAKAWIFSEHARITRSAIAKINDRASDDAKEVLLESARALGLCAAYDCSSKGCPVEAMTLEVLPALAGDHSCNTAELRTFIEEAQTKRGSWVRSVLTVAQRADARLLALRGGGDVRTREDIRRRLNVELQLVDADYVKRARLDGSHFQIAREPGPLDLGAYLKFVFDPSRDPNATAAYASYHVVALRLAAAAQPLSPGPARSELLRRALLAEVFAVHFLEDAFASGHFVGHWGSDATRLGTHDQYSTGIEALRWSLVEPGRARDAPYVAHGDAFLQPAEEGIVGDAVAKSMLQMLDVASNAEVAAHVDGIVHGAFGNEAWDTCQDRTAPPGLLALADPGPVRDVLADEPIPSPRVPPLQRFRSERGVFLGVSAAGDAGVPTLYAFGPSGGDRGAVGRFRAVGRIGYGARGLVDDSLNSQAFFDFGFTSTFVDATSADRGYAVTGYTMRLRAPGYLSAADGLVAIALAEITKLPPFIAWAAKAGGGGLGGFWRSRHLFWKLDGQISILRDVTLNRYPNEELRGQFRTELLGPLFTARSSIPITGDHWAQSTDLYLDIGPSATWSSLHPSAVLGAYLSFSASNRVFP